METRAQGGERVSETPESQTPEHPEPSAGRPPHEQRIGRWQDWAVVVLGVVTALTPLWVSVTAGAAWTMAVLGVLIALAALWSLQRPGSTISEYSHVVLGVLRRVVDLLGDRGVDGARRPGRGARRGRHPPRGRRRLTVFCSHALPRSRRRRLRVVPR
jgi:hypothetical protein